MESFAWIHSFPSNESHPSPSSLTRSTCAEAPGACFRGVWVCGCSLSIPSLPTHTSAAQQCGPSKPPRELVWFRSRVQGCRRVSSPPPCTSNQDPVACICSCLACCCVCLHKRMQIHRPKPLKVDQKAMILHTLVSR